MKILGIAAKFFLFMGVSAFVVAEAKHVMDGFRGTGFEELPLLVKSIAFFAASIACSSLRRSQSS